MFSEDISVFFADGETLTVGSTEILGKFDEPSGDEAGIGATRPTFMCETALLPSGFMTASIAYGARTFRVKGSPNRDETGRITTLELEEQ